MGSSTTFDPTWPTNIGYSASLTPISEGVDQPSWAHRTSPSPSPDTQLYLPRCSPEPTPATDLRTAPVRQYGAYGQTSWCPWFCNTFQWISTADLIFLDHREPPAWGQVLDFTSHHCSRHKRTANQARDNYKLLQAINQILILLSESLFPLTR